MGWVRRTSDYAFSDDGDPPVAMDRRGGPTPTCGRVMDASVGRRAPIRRRGELLTPGQELKIDVNCKSRPAIGLPVRAIKDHRVGLLRDVLTAGRVRRAAP